MTRIVDLPCRGAPPVPVPEPKPTAVALERAAWCRLVDERVTVGHSLAAAIRMAVGGREGAPSRSTLRRWYLAWKSGGAAAIADRRAGRQRRAYGWEARAVELWNQPMRPTRATVAYWLREEGWASATASRVHRYINSLPATVGGEDTPGRAGRHHHRQNIGPYVARDAHALDVGMIYQGDGHTCDVYVRHPSSGRPWRPELTVWIDVRSHYVAGWWLSEAESAISTLQSLSAAFLAHDHMPDMLHVDPGSGFVNNVMVDEVTGWLDRLGVGQMKTLPANAKGKGLVEGWFRWFEERTGKRFTTYVQRRTDRALKRMEASLRSGRVRVPTLSEYTDAVGAYIASYNAQRQRRLGAAPADLWAGIERNPVELPEAVLMRPAIERTVRRRTVTLFSREYRHESLSMVDGRKVLVEYDLRDAARVWVYYGKKLVCEAAWVERQPWMPASRIEDLRARREAGQKRRLDRKIAEVEARARTPIDGEAMARTAEAMLPERPADSPAAGGIDWTDALPD